MVSPKSRCGMNMVTSTRGSNCKKGAENAVIFLAVVLLALTSVQPSESGSLHSLGTYPNHDYQYIDNQPMERAQPRNTNGDPGNGVVLDYEDFSLGITPSTLSYQSMGPNQTTIVTDEYNLTVDWSEWGWVDYRIKPGFATDYIRYRRANPTQPIKGTIDEFGNPLNYVNMTISAWGLQGNIAWFVESCPEFSLNQTFTFFRDYMELNVTYYPGTKNVLTTYFIALFSDSNDTYDMFDGGFHRYMPGLDEELPKTHGMGGWYPMFTMYAPAMDMRVPQGDMGVEWGYNDTVAYLLSPIWINDFKGGASAFSVKYTSLNSVIPNIGLGTPETFHMFIRPYQYNDGKDKGYDVGYAQWVAKKIVDEWGYHDTPVFPLTMMLTGNWTSELYNWLDSSQTRLVTYPQDPNQMSWNYGSAIRRNREPADDPLLIPDDWELWGPGGQPQVLGNGDVILNPVSGTYKDIGSFRHHLIEDNPYNNWWWGSDAVFWDEMNTYTPDVKPRNDYHNRSEFVYEGYLKLVQESYSSGHWNFTITNPYTALLHLSMVSDLTIIESYGSSSTFGAHFAEHANSTMLFVNNIPEPYRPDILVYQYYNASGHVDDQEDVYRFLFGSARYGFHTALMSWSNQSHQIHNLEMAEKMYVAMGASRDQGIQLQAATLDLDVSDMVNTSSRVIVWSGNTYSPNIVMLNQEQSYNFTNLRAVPMDFGVSLNTNKYYMPNSSSLGGLMTFHASGEAWFNGTIEQEETEFLLRLDSFQVDHVQEGKAVVDLLELSETRVEFDLWSVEGVTNFTIGGLQPNMEFALCLNGNQSGIVVSNSAGYTSFTLLPDGNQTVLLVPDTSPPWTDLTIGLPQYVDASLTYVTNSTPFTLNASDGNGSGVNRTEYRIWNSGQWSGLFTYTNPFSPTAEEGEVSLEYYSVDEIGWIENPNNFTYILDKSPPWTIVSVGYPSFGSSPVYVTEDTIIDLDATDNGSGVFELLYQIDSGPFLLYSGPFNLSSAQNISTLRFRSTDNLGNEESTHEMSFYVDDRAPSSTIHVGNPNKPKDGVFYVNSSTEFALSVIDGGSGGRNMWYKIDNGAWTKYIDSFRMAGYSSFHTIHYNSTDNVMNHEPTRTLTVFLDDEPPFSTVYFKGDNAYLNGVTYVSTDTGIGVSSVDDGVGMQSIWFNVENSSWILYLGDIWLPEEGYHTIYYRGTDGLGNPEDPKSIVVFVDNTPPTASAGEDRVLDEGQILFFDGGLSSDNTFITDYVWSFDDVVLTGVAPSHRFEKQGNYTVTLTVTDILGMSGSDTLRVDVVDITPPRPPTGLRVEAEDMDELEMTWDPNHEEDLVGYNVYRSSNSGGPYAKINFGIASREYYRDLDLPEGTTYYYVVTAIDMNGNESPFSNEIIGTTSTDVGDGDDETDMLLVLAILAASMALFISAFVIMTSIAWVLLLRKRKERDDKSDETIADEDVQELVLSEEELPPP